MLHIVDAGHRPCFFGVLLRYFSLISLYLLGCRLLHRKELAGIVCRLSFDGEGGIEWFLRPLQRRSRRASMPNMRVTCFWAAFFWHGFWAQKKCETFRRCNG